MKVSQRMHVFVKSSTRKILAGRGKRSGPLCPKGSRIPAIPTELCAHQMLPGDMVIGVVQSSPQPRMAADKRAAAPCIEHAQQTCLLQHLCLYALQSSRTTEKVSLVSYLLPTEDGPELLPCSQSSRLVCPSRMKDNQPLGCGHDQHIEFNACLVEHPVEFTNQG